jgi:uncharacterized protein YkwD
MRKKPFRSRCLMLLALFVGIWSASSLDPRSLAGDVPRPLLTDASPNETVSNPVNPDVVLRQRPVDLDFSVFADIIPQSIYLNFFQNNHFIASLSRVESGTDGGLVWIGRIIGHPDSRVTLVILGRQASATVWVGTRRFDLRPLGDNQHIVQEIHAENLSMPAKEEDLLNDYSRSVDKSAPPLERGANMTSVEQDVFTLVNQERSKYSDLPALSADDRLTSAARAHSQDMSDNNYFSHTSLDGRTAGDRITAAGYQWNTYGENIAFGYSNPEAVMNGWMNSTGHRNNILSPNFCDLGVGYAADGNYWTQDFGRGQGVDQCPVANRAPQAVFTTVPDSGQVPLQVSLDAGASNDPDGDALTFDWTLGDGQTATGAAVSHTYETAGLFTIILTVSDANGGSDTTSRQITVTSQDNTAPLAFDDAYLCSADSPLDVEAPGVLGNDTDAQNPDALAAVAVTAPAHGALTLEGNGAFSYQPAAGFVGEDHFTYAAVDGQFQSEPATVTITVKTETAPQSSPGDSSGGDGGCFLHTASRQSKLN